MVLRDGTRGARLREAVRRSGLSQRQLAARVIRAEGRATDGNDSAKIERLRQDINKIAAGKRGIGMAMASRLAPHLGVAAGDLVDTRAPLVTLNELDSRLQVLEATVIDREEEQRWRDELRQRIEDLAASGQDNGGSRPIADKLDAILDEIRTLNDRVRHLEAADLGAKIEAATERHRARAQPPRTAPKRAARP